VKSCLSIWFLLISFILICIFTYILERINKVFMKVLAHDKEKMINSLNRVKNRGSMKVLSYDKEKK
jgi:hypothetical protein